MTIGSPIGLRAIIGGVLISLIACAVYSPALNYGFINLDDPTYVIKNGHIRSFDLSLVHWAFTTLAGGNWHPLTWLSLAFDYFLWGLNPMGFHLHNILLHAANVFFVMVLIYRLLSIYRDNHNLHATASDRGYEFMASALTALIFGLHPLRVESVVWVTERKDVLCAFFYLLSLLAYVSYAKSQDRNKAVMRYLLSLVAFSFALMSKSMAVTLPAVLLLLDGLCLGRMSQRKPAAAVRVIVEKVPFILLSLAVSAIAITGQTTGGGIRTLQEHSLPDRIVNAIHSIWFYVYKTILPFDLSPFYPILGVSALARPGVAFSFLFIITATLAAIIAYKHGKSYVAAIWGYYVITIVPVIGIIQVGDVGAADRFTYLPSVSISLLLGIGVTGFLRRFLPARKTTSGTYSVITVLLLPAIFIVYVTMQQITIWRDTVSLATRAIETHPGESPIPYLNRGFAWLDNNKFNNAVLDCSTALAMRPDCERCYFCRAEAYEKIGDFSAAIADYDAILRYNPVNANALHNRGTVYFKAGDRLSAQADFALRDQIEAGISQK